MMDPLNFLQQLQRLSVNFFTGVPDSLLKHFNACLADRIPGHRHVVTANEGAAVALAAGHYLGSGTPGLVYMQNSGLGNAVNPLLSLADKEVYGIPMLLLIGWRGEPGVVDEPQHVKQGRVQQELLQAMELPFLVWDRHSDPGDGSLDELLSLSKQASTPVAIVVKKGTFAPYHSTGAVADVQETSGLMSREAALEIIADALEDTDLVVSTTGMASRELYEIRERRGEGHEKDFLTVGSMGHCSQIALGLALSCAQRRIYCLDGDGSLLMHMGALPVIASQGADKLVHIVLNNGVHDSVGGQPTGAVALRFDKLALVCGYAAAYYADNTEDLRTALKKVQQGSGPAMLEVRIAKGARKDLGRPGQSPRQNKADLMNNLNTES